MTPVNKAFGSGTATEPAILSPRVLIPFLVVTLIWGSTWLVVRGQLGTVPVSWSLTYRFAIAAAAMFMLALATRQNVRIDKTVMLWTMAIGLLQFLFNFSLVYASEHYITSGLVAVIYALLVVPNAVLGRIWLGRSVSRSFVIGSMIAVVGVTLLIVREHQLASLNASEVLIGTGLALCGVCCVSLANVAQALPKIANYPTVTILAWAMLSGALANAVCAVAIDGAPVLDTDPIYIGGLLYLAIAGSVVTFPLYFRLVHDLGPGQAAYVGVMVPVVAMLLSTMFEGYIWSPLAVIGASLSAVGMLIAMRPSKATGVPST